MNKKFTRIGFSIQVGDDLSGCKFSLHLDKAGSSVTSEYLVPQTICWDTSTGTIGYITDNNWALTFEKTSTQMTLKITASDTPSTGTVLYSFTDGGITSYIDDYVVPDDFGKILYITHTGQSTLLKIMRRYPFFKFEKNGLTGVKYFYDIIYRLWSFMLLLRAYRNTIVQPFYYTYNIAGCTFTPKSGFTKYTDTNPSVTMYGNILYFYYDATKSTAWSAGNISNTAFVTFKIPIKRMNAHTHPYYEIQAMWWSSFLSGATGSLKSLTAQNQAISGNYLTFDVNVNAVQGADSRAYCNQWGMVRYKDIMR